MIGESIRKEIQNQSIVQHVKYFVRTIQTAGQLNVKKIRQVFPIVVGGLLENVRQKVNEIQTMPRSLLATSNFVRLWLNKSAEYILLHVRVLFPRYIIIFTVFKYI